MDPTLLFRLLVVAEGFEPTFFKDVDPAAGSLKAVLPPRREPVDPRYTVRGRVVDAKGEPVPYAIIAADVFILGNVGTGAPPEGADPLVVADAEGRFVLRLTPEVTRVNLRIEGRALAPLFVSNVVPGEEGRQWVLTEGASITGRVLKDGQPLRDITVGACGADRTMGNFVGDYRMATDRDGRFLLPNLPPDRMYVVYGAMVSLTNHGVLPLRKGSPGRDGETWELGDWEVVPGSRLAGQVRLADRKAIPPHSKLVISREEAWDSLALDLPPDGRFDVPNLPRDEAVSLSVVVPGYRLAAKNASLDPWGNDRLVGRLPADKTNLVVLLEPGPPVRRMVDSVLPEEHPQNFPLGGAETTPALPTDWEVSGTVVDAATGEPVQEFQVIPGSAVRVVQGVRWHRRRAAEGNAGRYRVGLPPGTRYAVLEVRAPGYLPQRSALLQKGQDHWDFRLEKGHGPKGRVLNPDGRPAVGASVWCLTRDDWFVWSPSARATAGMANPAAGVITGQADEEGRFELEPKAGDWVLLAFDKEGVGCLSREEAGTEATIRLQPWGRVRGRLVPPAESQGRFSLTIQPGGCLARERWPRMMCGSARLEGQLRFDVDRVPPGEARLVVSVQPVSSQTPGFLREVHRQSIEVPAGGVVDLGEIRLPPPETHPPGLLKR